MKSQMRYVVAALATLAILSGCQTSYSMGRGKPEFKPQPPIDSGLPLSRKVSLGIAQFVDRRPFVKAEEPKSYHCLSMDVPGLDVHRPVDWSRPKSYEGGGWNCTEEKTSELIQRILAEAFGQAGFSPIIITSESAEDSAALSLAKSKECEFLLTGTLKHFQTADSSGVVGGFYYLHQTIDLDVRLLRVSDGKCLLHRTFNVDSEETDIDGKYYRLMKTVVGSEVLLNFRFPPLVSRIIADTKDAVLKNN